MKTSLHPAVEPSVPLFSPASALQIPVAPLPTCEVCVIVPVRNEAAILPASLAALANQVDLDGQPLDRDRYEVIVLANNCTDDSAAIARQFARQHPNFVLHVVEGTWPVAEAYIGRMRQLLMDAAYDRLSRVGRRQGVIASTDGDSQVSPTWLAATLHEITAGADAVGGRILTDRASRAVLDPYARACHLREVGYRFLVAELETYLDPDPFDRWPRHYQHYGASLAVTVEMYALAGGLPPVRTPEDVAFYRSLLKVNARFRHSPLVKVFTSARQTGRADQGLSNQLNEWAKMGQERQPFLVESARAIATRFQSKRQLRGLWQRSVNGYRPTARDLLSLSQKLAVSAHWLNWELRQPQTFAELFEQVEQHQRATGDWQQRWPQVAIDQAIQDLRLHLQRARSTHNPQLGVAPALTLVSGGIEESRTQPVKEIALDLLSS